METIKRSGTVEKVVWSGDNGYKIVAVKFPGSFDSEKIVGYMNVIEGQSYTFFGTEDEHIKYGKQFKVTSYEMNDVKSDEEIIEFLSSNHFKGIGMRTASKIYNFLGENTLEVLKTDADCLSEINISQEIIAEIKNKLTGLDGIDELFKLLNPLNFSEYLITDIYQYLKRNEITDVLRYVMYNPYTLIDSVKLMTFQKADSIYLKYNVDCYKDIERLTAAFLFFGNELCYRSGNTLISNDQLFATLANNIDITNEEYTHVIDVLLNDNKIVKINDQFIMNKTFYDSEHGIARNIALRQQFTSKGLNEKRIRNQIISLEQEFNINYSDLQKDAIVNGLTNNISIITGGPGTGKTTIIKAIVTIFEQLKYPHEKVETLLNKIVLCAPTGRAAQRMKEATGHNAKTIHSLLEWDPHINKFNRNVDQPLIQELIVIDEFSMVDIFLANSLFKAIRPDAIVLIVGDPAQLESVAPGNVLGDFVDSNAISLKKLDLIFRQGDGSKIAELAQNIESNTKVELVNTHDMSVIEKKNNLKELVKIVVDKSYNAGYDEMETQVLYPKYAGASGIDALNEVLKPPIENETFETDERVYQIGDKVMQLKNNYDKNIYNGDIGYVTQIINKDAKGNQNALIVKFKNTSTELTRNELYDLTHAYAISIHKSQGSEFKVVVMPIDSSSNHMLTKKLIYTAITRAKDKLVIIGDVNYFYSGIEHDDEHRNTYLKQLLQVNDENQDNLNKENTLVDDNIAEDSDISPFDFL